MKKKKNKGGKKKRLENLLSFHKRLVVEKDLPPSRLMLQHATSLPSPHLVQRPEPNENEFKCDKCAALFNTKRGLKMHIRMMHKETQKPSKMAGKFDEPADHHLNTQTASYSILQSTSVWFPD